MKLIIQYYNSSNKKRNSEYKKCLEKNLENPLLDELIVFKEGSCQNPIENDKIKYLENERMTFQEMFDYCNSYLSGEICIVSNTDIYFDETLERLNEIDLDNKLITLTRWDILENNRVKFWGLPFSQDSWIFKAPIKIKNANFYMGIPGCDNKLAYLGKENNLELHNPSLEIKSYHLHLSKYRTYTGRDKVKPPYLTVSPSKINEKSKIGKLWSN